MILRLVLFLVLYAASGVALGAASYYGARRLLRGPLAAWRRRRLGARRHRAIERGRRALGVGDRCFVCLEVVDEGIDAFDPGRGWYHPGCLDRLLNE